MFSCLDVLTAPSLSTEKIPSALQDDFTVSAVNVLKARETFSYTGANGSGVAEEKSIRNLFFVSLPLFSGL